MSEEKAKAGKKAVQEKPKAAKAAGISFPALCKKYIWCQPNRALRAESSLQMI